MCISRERVIFKTENWFNFQSTKKERIVMIDIVKYGAPITVIETSIWYKQRKPHDYELSVIKFILLN